MSQLVDLIEGGYVGQAILATLIWVAILWLVVHGMDVPQWLLTAGTAILGFFFSSSLARVCAPKSNDAPK